jgi:signal peptidase I
MDTQLQRHAAFCELLEDIARSSGEVRIRVTGASMLPAVWPGDVLTVKSCPASDLQPGHIVLYRRDGRLTAHRILSISPGSVLTRGDSQVNPDPPIAESEIVGMVLSISRNGRTVPTAQTLWQRIASSILSRSDFLMRVALGLWRRSQARRNEPPRP